MFACHFSNLPGHAYYCVILCIVEITIGTLIKAHQDNTFSLGHPLVKNKVHCQFGSPVLKV